MEIRILQRLMAFNAQDITIHHREMDFNKRMARAYNKAGKRNLANSYYEDFNRLRRKLKKLVDTQVALKFELQAAYEDERHFKFVMELCK